MHDDETRQTSNRMPWEMNGHDVPTHVGADDTPGRAYAGRGATTEPVGAPASVTSTTQVDGGRRGRRWVIPVLLLLCGVCAFAIVTFFLSARHSSHPSGAGAATAHEKNAAAPADASSAAATGDFPDDAVPACLDADRGQEVDNPLKDEARMREGAKTTCGFIRELHTRVLEHLGADPDATHFVLKTYSTNLSTFIPMTCDRRAHLTHCTGGRSANVWIKDSLG